MPRPARQAKMGFVVEGVQDPVDQVERIYGAVECRKLHGPAGASNSKALDIEQQLSIKVYGLI
ncbi:hypothetical protein HFO97_27600 [Rhizobium leguminosarum]|uniref:hypothetical protein n=1 Tax=Rhizobium leguminosarum TaxID=384 RepID=UPI001C93EE15|nr:hypothetical protein [Rhizobium leguminosarum]MBY5363641.1 hypothetical protein [Rhizobium leguminosarum]